MKIGALIIGHRGATASTLIAATKVAAHDELASYLLTSRGAAAKLGLGDPKEIVFAGWDPFSARESWAQTLNRHGVMDLRRWPELPARLGKEVRDLDAIALSQDHAVVHKETAAATNGAATLARVRAQIREFASATGVDALVVVNLSAPAALP